MATIHLPPDFKEFLELLNSHQVEYLIIGGYAVGYHGYPRPTGDLDIWIAIHPRNAKKVGVDFNRCYANRIVDELDGVQANVINLNDLKANKKASGRFKDLNDLENLP